MCLPLHTELDYLLVHIHLPTAEKLLCRKQNSNRNSMPAHTCFFADHRIRTQNKGILLLLTCRKQKEIKYCI